MDLQQKRVAVFVAATLIGFNITADLFIDRFALTWYNVLEGLFLLPCLMSAALLLRLWIKQAKRRKDAAAYRKRLMISGQL